VQTGESCELPDGDMCKSCKITCCGSCFYAHLSLAGSICRSSDGSACKPSCDAAGEVCTTLAGTDRTDCQALLGCMLTNLSQCTKTGRGALGCYCSDLTCSAGANGPCSAQFQAVAKTTDTAEVRRQIADWTTTAGGVSVEAVAFGSSSCGRACSDGLSVCGYP
jgi:hypothetical protein